MVRNSPRDSYIWDWDDYDMSEPWMTREQKIHERVFDTLSRPLSRASGGDNMFSGKKVRWNHFGKKYTLRISDYEMEYADLYDAFMKKVHEVRPDFDGQLAYINPMSVQVIVQSDKDMRDALQATKGKLKLHTTMREGTVLAAADMLGRPARSQSVPPERSYHNYPPANSRSPSSMDSAPATYRPRAASPSPMGSDSQPREIVKTTASYASRYKGWTGVPYWGGKIGYGPYSQSIIYGLPPHNAMLMRFLGSPFPFGYGGTYLGPNKYITGWHHKYYTSGWGPVW